MKSAARAKGISVHDDYGEIDPQPEVRFELSPAAIPSFPNQFHLPHAEYDRCIDCGSDQIIILGKKSHERMCLECKEGSSVGIVDRDDLEKQLSNGAYWAALSGHMHDNTLYRSIIPECENGDWKVVKVRPSDEQVKRSENSDLMLTGGRGVLYNEEYTSLRYKDELAASDTPDEITDHYFFLQWATGKVLISGLGLGIALQMVIEDEDVTEIHIVEKRSEIRELIMPHFVARYPDHMSKVIFIQDDIYDFNIPEGFQWDVIWHDIFSSNSPQHLEGMTKLYWKFEPHAEEWMGFRNKEFIERFVKPNYDSSQEFRDAVFALGKI